MGGVRDGQLTPIGPFTGVNNVAAEHEAPSASLRRADNVDITDAGRVRRRDGYALKYALVGARSAWSAPGLGFGLVASYGKLFQFSDDYAPREVADVDPFNDVAYTAAAGTAVYSDGRRMRTVMPDGTTLPLHTENPAGQPDVVTLPDGPWPTGQYQVAVTFVDENGRESGTGESAYVSIAAPSQLRLVAIPQSSGLYDRVNVYVTEPDGATLYQRAQLVGGMPEFTVPRAPPGVALETQHLFAMPAGTSLAESNGRLYAAVANMVWYSAPMRYGLTRATKNFVLFPHPVDGIAAVGEANRGSGVYVSTGNTVRWLDGANPEDFQTTQAYPHGAVPGTMIRVPASYFNVEGVTDTQMLVHWVSTNGVLCLGLPGGTVLPYSERTVLADGSYGASAYVEREGVRQVLNNLSGDPNNRVRAEEKFSARVFRNGVEI